MRGKILVGLGKGMWFLAWMLISILAFPIFFLAVVLGDSKTGGNL